MERDKATLAGRPCPQGVKDNSIALVRPEHLGNQRGQTLEVSVPRARFDDEILASR